MTSSHETLEEGPRVLLDWDKLQKVTKGREKDPVLPVAVQDVTTLQVLIVAFANRKAVLESFKQKVCVLWSTSRNELWVKGATSGDVLDLVEVRINCEQNSLLYLVRPRRTGACHTKGPDGHTRPSCYYRRLTCTGELAYENEERLDDVFEKSMVLEHLSQECSSG